MRSRRSPSWGEFSAFVADVEPRLLQGLVARYGPADGREATIDALSWAWENWQRLADVRNKAGYLYRVGQSATRRFAARPLPSSLNAREADAHLDQLDEVVDRDLMDALRALSEQQRTVVVLVHAFDWTQTDVAEFLEITPSTVREHLSRALDRLRQDLEVHDAC